MTEIYLNCKKVKDQDINKFIPKDVLKYTYLRLGYNQITQQGIYFLSQRNWQNLTYLNLKNNRLGNKGLKNLALINFSSLKTLNVGSNMIDDTGIRYLTKGIYRSLEILVLYENHLRNETAILSKARMKSLKEIWLSFDQNNKSKLTLNVWTKMMGCDWKLVQLYFPVIQLTTYELQNLKKTGFDKFGLKCDITVW